MADRKVFRTFRAENNLFLHDIRKGSIYLIRFEAIPRFAFPYIIISASRIKSNLIRENLTSQFLPFPANVEETSTMNLLAVFANNEKTAKRGTSFPVCREGIFFRKLHYFVTT